MKGVFIDRKRTRTFKNSGFTKHDHAFGLEFQRMPDNSDNKPDAPAPAKTSLVSLARYSEMGFIIPAAILLGFFLGKLADYWLHTKWLYLVGLLFGAVVGFSQMIRMALRANKDAS
jgi:F0F1-type ATP synthase assembly protein I